MKLLDNDVNASIMREETNNDIDNKISTGIIANTVDNSIGQKNHSLLKILYLLDTSQQYHTLGNEKYQSYHWHKTRYIHRQAGGALMNTNNHEMFCTQLLSIRKQIMNDGETINDDQQQNNTKSSISLARFMIQTEKVPYQQTQGVQHQNTILASTVDSVNDSMESTISNDKDRSANYMRYRLVDRFQQQPEEPGLRVHKDEEKESKICDLIPEGDDNDNMNTSDNNLNKSSTFGLRQRRGASATTMKVPELNPKNHDQKQCTKKTDDHIMVTETIPTLAATDNCNGTNHDDTTATTATTTTTNKKKKENFMDIAQQDMIQSLRYYIHAATLVASIQQEINNAMTVEKSS